MNIRGVREREIFYRDRDRENFERLEFIGILERIAISRKSWDLGKNWEQA